MSSTTRHQDGAQTMDGARTIQSQPVTADEAGLTTGVHREVIAAVRAVAIAVTAVTVIALLFLWPLRAATAKDIPVALAGPPQAVQLVERQLADAGAPFVASTVADRDAAIRAIRQRETYGAIVVRPGNPGSPTEVEILTASAAAPVVAQALGQVASRLQAAAPPGMPIAAHTTDVVPLADNDPRGAGIAMLALPLGIGGLVVGALVAVRLRRVGAKASAILVASVLAGLAWTLILHPWFGILTGSFGTEWGLASLAVAATGAFVAGMHAVAGLGGAAVAALITTPFAFPLAGTSVPKEFLPDPWGAIGQGLVPGAASTAFRLESYFPDASLATPLLVLTCWLLLGAGLLLVGRHRRGRGGVPGVRGVRPLPEASLA